MASRARRRNDNPDSAVSGDMGAKQQSFEAMVGALTDDLYRFAYWLCRDSHLAEDLVQETLLRAWRSVDKLRDAKAVKSWLITTLRREHARLYERKRPPLVDVEGMELEDAGDVSPDHATDVSMLHHHIMDLAVEYREPLALQVLMGHSVAEIAEMLELSESAVMTRLFRARKQIMAKVDSPARSVGNQTVTGER